MAQQTACTPLGKVHALITGPPGIGKTTLVRAVCQKLQDEVGSSVLLHGFYTEEVREGGASKSGHGPRIGFDVVTFSGERGPLARVERPSDSAYRDQRPAVGRYRVNLESFEELALPTLQRLPKTGDEQHLYVIDEIGKMELFSKKFIDIVKRLFCAHNEDKSVVMATIPVARQRSHWLVEELRQRNDCFLFEVSERNRDSLVSEITEFLKNRYSLVA